MDETTKPTQDERLLAAIVHTGIFFGFLGTIVIWLTQKDKSMYVGFQAKQAFLYQIFLFIFGILGLIMFIILFIPLIFLGIGFLLLLIFLMYILGWAYGFYGAYKCWKGEDFKYVVIGDMVSK